MPSRLDNLPFTVIEASLIPGLNLICSNVGGIPEVFNGKGQNQMFEPSVTQVRQKVEACLVQGVSRLVRSPRMIGKQTTSVGVVLFRLVQ